MFLTNKAITRAIKAEINKATTIDLAVSYWGKGASQELGLRAGRNGKVRIVCDLLSGATNPAEIEVVRKKFALPKNVRHLTGLHAKVYLTDKACIVGSSNASTNGLGNEGGDLGLVEAALRVDAKEDVSSASKWFKDLWEKAKVVTKADLRSAQILWDQRKHARPTTSIRHHKSEQRLLGADLKDLAGRNIYLVIYHEGLSREGRSTADDAVKENNSLSSYGVYEEDPPKGNKSWLPLNSYGIDCRIHDRSGKIAIDDHFSATWNEYQADNLRYPNGKRGYLVWVKPQKIIELGQTKLSISSSDKRKIAAAIRKLPGYKTRDHVIPIEKLKL